MKIVGAEVFVTCPGRNFVTLKITTEDGITGLGDATLNGRELPVASYLTDHLCPQLIGGILKPKPPICRCISYSAALRVKASWCIAILQATPSTMCWKTTRVIQPICRWPAWKTAHCGTGKERKMKSIVIEKPNTLTIETRALPQPAPGEVLIFIGDIIPLQNIPVS